jgi:hypothetical protein
MDITHAAPVRSRKIVVLLTTLLLAATPGLLSAAECKVLDQKGEERDCTATEELGKCLTEAGDSYSQCRLDNGIILCGAALVVDSLVCYKEILS